MNQERVHEGLIQTANAADRQHQPQTVANRCNRGNNEAAGKKVREVFVKYFD